MSAAPERCEQELDPAKQAQVDEAKDVFAQLLKGFKSIGLYRHNTARYGEFIEGAFARLTSYVGKHQSLGVKIEAQSFTLFGQSLLPPGADENLAYKFHRDGIRHLVFRQGVTQEELLKFALIAITNFDDPQNRGADILSSLWNAGLEHIEHLVVEGFSVGELSEEEVQVEVDKIVGYLYQRLRSTSDDFLRFARLSADDLSLKMEAVDQLRGAVIQGTPVTEKLAQQLQGQLSEDEGPRLLPKLVQVIFSILDEEISAGNAGFEEILAQLIDAMLLQEDFGSISQILVKLRAMERSPEKAAGAAKLKNFVTEKLGEPERLRRIIDVLRAGVAKQPQEIQRYLASLDARAVIPLLEGLEQIELPQNRQLLCDALTVLGAETPDPFISRLSSDRSALVRDMLYILEKIDIPDRTKMFEGALRNNNIAVRLEALGVIAKGRTEANRALLVQALSDSSTQVRAHAARALVKFDPARGFQDIQRLIRAPDFAKKPLEERQLLYAAIGASQLPAALTLFAQMLQQKGGLMRKRKVADDKLLAIAGLSECPSLAAYKLLQTESANTDNEDDVLTAARRAMGLIRRNLFGTDAPPAGE
ncbi:MAG: HEAT repeat domain-containing protein [Deltaproteobacteria bacterium]